MSRSTASALPSSRPPSRRSCRHLLPPDLAAANSLDQFVRPIALRLAGPALGGALVAGVGTGTAFAVDAATFVASAVAVFLMRPPAHPRSEHVDSSFSAVKEGLRFVRRRVWLWGTLLSAAIAYLAFLGPAEVLLPYIVKNDLHASAGQLGLVFAAGGVGAIGSALFMGQRGHPGRDVTFMYATWTVATLAVAGYGLATASWQLMVACLLFNALETAGTIVWATIKQRHVPASMLGRVSSLDWLISIGLLPLSFALTGSGRRPGWRASHADRSGRDRRCIHAWRALPPRHAGHRGHGQRGRRTERQVTSRRRARPSEAARIRRPSRLTVAAVNWTVVGWAVSSPEVDQLRVDLATGDPELEHRAVGRDRPFDAAAEGPTRRRRARRRVRGRARTGRDRPRRGRSRLPLPPLPRAPHPRRARVC